MRSFYKITYIRSLLLLSVILLNACSKDDTSPNDDYNNVRIMSVKILELPATASNGSGWDFTNGPDVYLDINAGSTNVYSTSSNRFNDITTYPIKWNFIDPLVISNLNIQYNFLAYDYDTPDADDYMGGVGYIFANATSHPNKLVISYQGTKMELELQWFKN